MDGILMSSRPKGWPRHAYQKRAGAIFLGLGAVFAAWMFEWQFEWDGMQKYYLAHYVVANTGLIHKYLVLHTVDRKGKWRPAVPDEVVPVNLDHPVRGVIHGTRQHQLRHPDSHRPGVGLYSQHRRRAL